MLHTAKDDANDTKDQATRRSRAPARTTITAMMSTIAAVNGRTIEKMRNAVKVPAILVERTRRCQQKTSTKFACLHHPAHSENYEATLWTRPYRGETGSTSIRPSLG